MVGVRMSARLAIVVGCALAVTAAAGSGNSTLRGALHTHLIKSEPAANDTLIAIPRALRLWFSEKVELPVTRVKLTDAAGAAIELAPLARPDTGEHAPIVATLRKPLPPGTYLVTWSTAAKDGHPAKGSYPFVMRSAH
jgi:methionine-rich copper-binding protein CopC